MLRQWDDRSIRCARYPRSRRCSDSRHGVLLLHSRHTEYRLRSAPPVSRLAFDRPPTVRELCDRLGECAVETAWTREDAKKWWETRMEPEVAVTFGDWT